MAPRKAKPDPKSAAAAEGVAAAAGAAAPTPESAPGLMPSHYAPLLPVGEHVQEQPVKTLQIVLPNEVHPVEVVMTVSLSDGEQSALDYGVADMTLFQLMTAVPGTESWLYGYMDVQARAPMGFWRCNQHFLHSAPTRVFVVHDKALIPHDHSCDMLCAYLLPAEAQRVADEPHLKVLG